MEVTSIVKLVVLAMLKFGQHKVKIIQHSLVCPICH